MANSFNNDYEDRLLGAPSEESYTEEEPEVVKNEESEEYYQLPLAIKSRSLIWSVISFAAAVLSLALCLFSYVGITFAVVSVVFSLFSRRNLGFFEKYSILGLILGIIGFVCSIFSLIADAIGIFA